MAFRDIGRWLCMLLVILVIDLLLALTGVREPRPSDYDRACIVAAIAVVLWAIREERPA